MPMRLSHSRCCWGRWEFSKPLTGETYPPRGVNPCDAKGVVKVEATRTTLRFCQTHAQMLYDRGVIERT